MKSNRDSLAAQLQRKVYDCADLEAEVTRLKVAIGRFNDILPRGHERRYDDEGMHAECMRCRAEQAEADLAAMAAKRDALDEQARDATAHNVVLAYDLEGVREQLAQRDQRISSPVERVSEACGYPGPDGGLQTDDQLVACVAQRDKELAEADVAWKALRQENDKLMAECEKRGKEATTCPPNATT